MCLQQRGGGAGAPTLPVDDGQEQLRAARRRGAVVREAVEGICRGIGRGQKPGSPASHLISRLSGSRRWAIATS